MKTSESAITERFPPVRKAEGAEAFKRALKAPTPADIQKKAPTLPKPHGRVAMAAPASKKVAVLQPIPKSRATVQSLSTAAGHQAVQSNLGRARASHDQLAHHLDTARMGHHYVADTHDHQRLIDTICQELMNEPMPKQASNQDQPLPYAMPSQSVPATVRTTAAGPSLEGVAPLSAWPMQQVSKAEAATALIEKIETFVKSQRPGLSLTLDNSLGARVDIERIGPKEVALKLVGRNGPPSPEDVNRIRDEMHARGLKVGALSVG